MPRPPPPKAALMISGKSDLFRDLARASASVTGCSVPGMTGTPAFCARRRAAVLSPSSSSSSARRTDERDPRRFAGAGQSRVFGKKSVARMDGVDALFGGQRDDAVHVQIGLNRTFACADQVGFIGLEAMQAQPIFLRIDRDGSQAQLGGRAKDTDGDLTTVQREQFFHGKPVLGSGWRH